MARFKPAKNKHEQGNALFYVFLAIGLMGVLTFSLTKGTKENFAVHNASRVAEELYVQANLIKASVKQCTMEWIKGAGDLNLDGIDDISDNPNTPFPLPPSNLLIDVAPAGCTTNADAPGCAKHAADDKVINLACIGAPIGFANMFSGSNNTGAFLPPAPTGFEDWTYHSNADGVYIQIMAKTNNMTYDLTLSRLHEKYGRCQSNINYKNCGDNCFVTWIKRKECLE